MTDEGFNFFKNYQNGLLENVFDWNFPIFELAEKTECVLSQVCFWIKIWVYYYRFTKLLAFFFCSTLQAYLD